jgi:acetolactate synthase I/II/III large subunit
VAVNRVRVADYVVSYLHQLGVRVCYSVSGTGSIYLDDAFASHPGVTWVCARHETAAALMATGSAKLTGELAVALVSSGPGAVNALAGLVDAYADGVPVLIVSGQVETRHLDPGARSFGVQGFDVVSSARSLTKYAVTVDDASTIGHHLREAVRRATTGRPGPVWLDIPLDVQAAAVDPPAAERPGPGDPRPAADDEAKRAAEQIVSLLSRAQRPLIVAGQGVRQAGAVEAFRELVGQLGVPVVTSRLGTDLLPFGSALCMGQGGIRGRLHTGLVMEEADLIVSLGSSLSIGFVAEDAGAFDSSATVVAVDIDPGQLRKKGVGIDHPWCVDVGAVIRHLRALAPHGCGQREAWTARCTGLKRRYPMVSSEPLQEPINSYQFIGLLERHTGSTDVFAIDTGSAYYVTGQTLEFEGSQREITSAAFLNMGAAVPMAVGAAFARPDHRMLVIVGDGAIELNIQELATISQYGLDVKVFVLNNGGYASIRESQFALCQGPALAEPESLNFPAVAEAFRLPYRRLAEVATLGADLRSVLAETGPALVEVMCDPDQKLLRPLRADRSARAFDGASVPPPEPVAAVARA